MATETQAPEAALENPSPTPAAGNPTPDLAEARRSEMAALLAQMSNPQPIAPEPEPEPVTPEAETGTPPPPQPEEETETEDPETEEDSDHGKREPSKSFRGRWDHLDPQERRVIELTTKKGLTLSEAQRAVYGEAKGPQQAQTPQPSPTHAIEAQLGEINQTIESLEARIQEAAFDPDAQAALRKELRAAERKAGVLENRMEMLSEQEKAETQRRAQEQARSVEQDSFLRAFEAFPDAYAVDEQGVARFNPQSRLGKLAAAEDRLFHQTQNPIVNSPDYHEFLLARVAALIGYQNDGQAAPLTPAAPAKPVTAAKPTVPQAAPKRGVRPVATGGMEPSTPSPQQDLETALASNNPEALLAMMRAHGTKF